MTQQTDLTSAHNKAFKARLVTNLLILLLSLVSLIILKIHVGGFWIYTAIICIVAAVLCVLLSGYLSYWLKCDQRHGFLRILIYWAGFLAALYLDALMKQYGSSTATQSGLFALILLAAALFCVGILYDLAFLLTGLAIGLMVAGSIILSTYLLLVIIPVAIIMGFFIFLLARNNNAQTRKTE
jgi:hypothetical protein